MDEGVSSSIKTILFDMDGVITSELAYWKSAALTVYEYFHNDYELNRERCYEDVDQIMATVFSENKTIEILKSLSVNSNWDLTYLTILATEILRFENSEDESVFDKIPDFLMDKNASAPELFDVLAEEYEEAFNMEDCSKESEFYKEIQNSFQRWYHGGLIECETPLIGMNETVELISYLHNKGYTLGIGTGRPYIEIKRPLENWGILKYFDADRIISYDDVIADQFIYNKNREEPVRFAKPHPYTFLKGAKGKNDFSLSDLDDINPDSSVDKTSVHETSVLAVGDAVCDFEAAKAAGFKFCAVLTGVDGKESENYFINEGADFVLDNASILKEIL